MDRKTLITVFVLVCLPILSLIYKLSVANISLLPVALEDTILMEVLISPKDNEKARQISFPIPKNFTQTKLLKNTIRSNEKDFRIIRKAYGHLGVWEGEDWESNLGFSAKLELEPYQNESPPSSRFPIQVSEREKLYLAESAFTPIEWKEGNKIFEKIHPYEDDDVKAAKQIFYYIEEEIVNSPREMSLQETIRLSVGNAYTKSLLFSLLARKRGIPTRTVAGFDISSGIPRDKKIKLTFWNEVKFSGKWYYVSTTKNEFAKPVKGFIPIWKLMEEKRDLFGSSSVRYTAYLSETNLNRYNFEEYSEAVQAKSSYLKYYSLYRLPLHLQNVFRIVLLIPIGALVLSLARNCIGVPTFGIFTPILLSVFFYESGFWFGTLFFLLMVGLGYLERYFLDKFFLLAVPRLSVLLTITVLSLIVFSVLNQEFSFFNNVRLTLFPIVISTVFVERFSIMVMEEGAWNTFITLLGTLGIAFVSYLLFFLSSLQILFFTNPELLLIVIAMQILVGNYKGYRLSEYFRFREMFRS